MKKGLSGLGNLFRISGMCVAIIVIAGCASGVTIIKHSLSEEMANRNSRGSSLADPVMGTALVGPELSGNLRQVWEVRITDTNTGEEVILDKNDFLRSITYTLVPGTYEVTVFSGIDTESSITITVAQNRLTMIDLKSSGELFVR